MNLLLTSEGLTTEAIQQKFFGLVDKKPEDIRVAFIPTAAHAESEWSWVEDAKEDILKLGIKTITDINLEDYSGQQLYEKLAAFDVIWANGGNTFFLLSWVNKSGFDQIIKRLLNDGKAYVGVSAGSILATPTIEVAGWKGLDDPKGVKLDDLTALHLVDFHIFPHFRPQYIPLINNEKQKLDGKLIILNDLQATDETGEII